MRNFRNCAVGVAVLLFAFCAMSCSPKASVRCTVADAPGSEVIVKLLNINRYDVLDTVKTNSAGQLTYKIDVKKGDPEFVYLFYKDNKIASLLLQAGDRVVVEADTLGHYTVSGSPESEKLSDVEASYSAFIVKMVGLSDLINKGDLTEGEATELQRTMSREYVDYYRDRLRYVVSNPYSLTTVPVFFQTMGSNIPVFSQETDAIYFGSICDSLEMVYPDSRYVKALRQESSRRMANLQLSRRFDNVEEVSFLDVELPDVNGVKRKLSEVDAKLVLMHFWSSSEALHKMFNLEVLKPVYDDFKAKGMEVYEIALDTDKAAWARVVKEQGLDWINVCDGLGTSSPVVTTYNITTYPVSFLLVDGQLVDDRFTDEPSLRRVVAKYLK